MARIVVSEFIDERALARLRAAGHDVVYDAALVDYADRLRREAAGADALIVRNRTQVRGALLAALTRCRVIGRLGVGLDNIDTAACAARGIRVLPATGANAQSVAEYVVTAALMLLRGAYFATADVAAGRWPRAALSLGREANGKSLGLIGFGSIGQRTGALARAIGMEVAAFDAMLDADHPAFAAIGVRCAGLEEVITTSDAVSLHVPLLDSTRGLFDARRIASMKRGAVLINTARGGIVDEAALADALRRGHLAGAAIDVFDSEPLAAAPHFRDCPNLILTPHIAGLSLESNERVGLLIADRVLQALA